MARYIDADALLRKMRNTSRYFYVKYDIEDFPTADVVPKSEYEQLKAMYEDNEAQRAYTINMLGESLENAKSEIEMLQGALKAEEQHNELTMEMAQKALKNAKAEVAREIFAEIQEEIQAALKSNYEARRVYNPTDEFGMWVQGKIDALRGIEDFLAELKKKYTEDQNDGNA